MKAFSLFFLIFYFILPSHAYLPKEGTIHGLFGTYLYKNNFENTSTGANSPILLDFGLIAQGDVNDTSAIEITVFHLHKIFLRDQANKYTSEETEAIHIGMGYRRWITSTFALGLSFYSAYSMGDPKMNHSDFSIGNELDTSARDNVEYGFDFSIQKEIWAQNQHSVIADARYSLSVTNKQNEKGDDYGLFLAYKFFAQEK